MPTFGSEPLSGGGVLWSDKKIAHEKPPRTYSCVAPCKRVEGGTIARGYLRKENLDEIVPKWKNIYITLSWALLRFFLCGGGWDTRRLKGLCLELDLIGLLSDVTVVLLILSRFN